MLSPAGINATAPAGSATVDCMTLLERFSPEPPRIAIVVYPFKFSGLSLEGRALDVV